MVAKKITVQETVSIHQIEKRYTRLRIIGETGLYMNSMSAKAKRDLLLGAARKPAAEKKEIKHNPEEEFVDSCYINGTNGSYLSFPSTGIKRGMATAALETAGVTKASINRGIYVVGEHINVWGKPYMNMSVVRSSDINRTPDIRTRAKLPNWCTEVTVRYINPTFSQLDITALLVNAGTLCGLGDWRIEKGGPMGGYRIVQTKDDQKIFDRLVKEEGDTCQKLALENPEIEAHDNMSHELYEAITQERLKRAAIIKEVA